jgi:hypothetical protein
MILCLQAPVLSMPQMFDSLHTQRLAQDEHFREILREGIVGTSLFGQHGSLKGYVLHCLRRPGYIFSSLPFLDPNTGQFEAKEIELIKNVLIKRLENDSNSDEKYPYPVSIVNRNVELSYFVEGILALNEAIRPEYYRQNLESAISISDIIKANLDSLNKQFGDKDPHVAGLRELIVTLERENKGNDRSSYRSRLSLWEQEARIQHEECAALKEVVDLSYNQFMASRIARDSRLDVNESNSYASFLLNINPAEKSWDEAVKEARADCVYSELCEEIPYDSGPSHTHINWEMLLEIVRRTKTGLNREEIMEKIYKDYYCDKILSREYGISVEPTPSYNPRIPSMRIEASERDERGKKKRKKIEEIETLHENSEKVKEVFTKKVRGNYNG